MNVSNIKKKESKQRTLECACYIPPSRCFQCRCSSDFACNRSFHRSNKWQLQRAPCDNEDKLAPFLELRTSCPISKVSEQDGKRQESPRPPHSSIEMRHGNYRSVHTIRTTRSVKCLGLV